jgi:hypothetical protein
MRAQLIVIPLVLAGMASVAQAEDKKPTAERDKRLEYFVGSWDVTARYKLPDGRYSAGNAVCESRWVLSDKFVKQEYKSIVMGQPLTVVQILGFDTIKKKFVEFQLHVHGPQTHTLHNEGAFSEDGRVLILIGDSIDGFTGKPVKLRAVTTVVDKDHYALDWFRTQAGGKEEHTVVLEHSRRK